MSINEKTLFIGAGDNITDTQGTAFLVALDITNRLQVMQYTKYPDSTGYNLVSALRRHPTLDVLFVGTLGYIVTVNWTGKEFMTLSQVENRSDHPITDLCFDHNLLIGVSDDSVGTAVHFDKKVAMARDPRLNNQNRFAPKKRHISPAPRKDATVSKVTDLSKVHATNIQGDLRGSGSKLATHQKTPINPFERSPSPNKESKLAGRFENIKIRKVPLLDNKQSDKLYRLDFLQSASTVVYGKNQVHKLIEKGNHYVKLKDTAPLIPFNDLKIFKNGEILVLEEASLDLVKYGPTMIEAARLKGTPSKNMCKRFLN